MTFTDEQVDRMVKEWFRDRDGTINHRRDMRTALEKVFGKGDDLKCYARGFKDGYQEGYEAASGDSDDVDGGMGK